MHSLAQSKRTFSAYTRQGAKTISQSYIQVSVRLSQSKCKCIYYRGTGRHMLIDMVHSWVSYKIWNLAYTLVITESFLSFYHALYLSCSLAHPTFFTNTHLRAFGGLSDVWHSTLTPPPFPGSASLGPDSAFNAEGKNTPPFILFPHLFLFFSLTLDFFSSFSLPPTPVPQLCLGLLSPLLPGPHLIIQSLTSPHFVIQSL